MLAKDQSSGNSKFQHPISNNFQRRCKETYWPCPKVRGEGLDQPHHSWLQRHPKSRTSAQRTAGPSESLLRPTPTKGYFSFTVPQALHSSVSFNECPKSHTDHNNRKTQSHEPDALSQIPSGQIHGSGNTNDASWRLIHSPSVTSWSRTSCLPCPLRR